MSHRRRVPAAVLLAAVPAALAVTSGVPGAGAATTKRVVLEDIRFKPATVRITRGSRVTWVWRDDRTPHNVASRGTKRFRSAGTRTEGTHTVRFRRSGTYRYVCTIHLGMAGKVVVR